MLNIRKLFWKLQAINFERCCQRTLHSLMISLRMGYLCLFRPSHRRLEVNWTVKWTEKSNFFLLLLKSREVSQVQLQKITIEFKLKVSLFPYCNNWQRLSFNSFLSLFFLLCLSFSIFVSQESSSWLIINGQSIAQKSPEFGHSIETVRCLLVRLIIITSKNINIAYMCVMFGACASNNKITCENSLESNQTRGKKKVNLNLFFAFFFVRFSLPLTRTLTQLHSIHFIFSV
jgi:uncharacterized membrane protein